VDQIALGVLTEAFPPELIDEAVEATGRREARRRRLPARVVVYATGCCWYTTHYDNSPT
jgi:hypothetical protein